MPEVWDEGPVDVKEQKVGAPGAWGEGPVGVEESGPADAEEQKAEETSAGCPRSTSVGKGTDTAKDESVPKSASNTGCRSGEKEFAEARK